MALTERFRGFNVASSLALRATSDPQRPFLVSDGGSLTFDEVDSQSDALAAALANLGVERGDRVALVLPACPEFVVSLFAAAKSANSTSLTAVVSPRRAALLPWPMRTAFRSLLTIRKDRSVLPLRWSLVFRSQATSSANQYTTMCPGEMMWSRRGLRSMSSRVL